MEGDVMIFKNEDDFQKAVNEDLRKLGIPFRHRYKSPGRKGQSLNTFTIDGVKMAWLDLVIYLPGGKTIFIELKHGKGKFSPEQINCRDYLIKQGYHCYSMWEWEHWELIKKIEGIE